jgi:TPR repeat protein
MTYEAAAEAALEGCEELSDFQSFTSGGCRLLAVGNTIVWDMPEVEREQVVAAYRVSRAKIVIPSQLTLADAKILSSDGLAGFRRYIRMDAYGKFKVFAAARKGAWSYRSGVSYDTAAKAALDVCQSYAGSGYSQSSKCRLFAVGDTVVWNLSKREAQKVIAAYRDAGPSEDPFLASKEIAARQGSAQAKFELGNAYQRGWWGAAKDMTKAAMWYRMAAEQGHKEAQYWIGMMSVEGVGVAQDIVEGYMWLILASDAGFSSASTKRDEVGAALTHAQMSEAQRLAQGWKAKRN